MWFKLVKGNTHIHPVKDENGKDIINAEGIATTKVYKKGDRIETDVPLDKLFRGGKFVRINVDGSEDIPELPDIPRSPDIPKPDVDEADKKIKSSLSKSGKKGNPYGKRVRNVFKRTKRHGVKVYVKKGWYSIVDKIDGGILNDVKLREDDVQAFINSLEDDDD